LLSLCFALHADSCYTTSTPFHSCTTAESHVQRTADTTVHACTCAEQHSWRASGGPLQDPCRHDATTPQETHFRVTGSSEMRLQELHALRSPPDDRRKDLPSTIPDLMCSGSASLRAPMCGKWSRTVGLQILPPSQLVPAPWHKVPSSGTTTLFARQTLGDLESCILPCTLPCDRLAKHLDPAKRRVDSSSAMRAEEQVP
jgi:hypothetical protein